MKKAIRLLFVSASLLMACSKPNAEKYFTTAALNCNLLYGFAGPGMQRELESPSEKLVDEKTYATAPMKRAEVINEKLKTLQINYEKVKSLPADNDAGDMIAASLALYEFTLPVYKDEYMNLAGLYDSGADPEKITKQQKNISDKYGSSFDNLYNKVMSSGKAYAQKHGIPVQEVSPAPR